MLPKLCKFRSGRCGQQSLPRGGKLNIPVLAVGEEKSFGTNMAAVMRFAASDVEGEVVLGSGHWVTEENPKATVVLVRAFLDKD
jgi:pimeloyl-ACP methyl ester carboxylesterase